MGVRFFPVLLLLLSGCALGQGKPEGPISVCVRVLEVAGGYRYEFELAGVSVSRVVTIALGRDSATGNPSLDLRADRGIADVESRMTMPSGWKSMIITQEEHESVWLEWNRLNGGGTENRLLSHHRFGVIMTSRSPCLETAQFEAILDDGTQLFGRVRPCL